MISTSSLIAGVAATLSLGLGACAHHPEEETTAELPPAAPAPSAAQTPAESMPPRLTFESLPEPDRAFMRQAVAANATALRFGQLAAHRGTTVEVRSLGREMVDTNTGLAEQLRQSASTVGVTLPIPAMRPDEKRIYDQLATLSGQAFDQAFLRSVVKIQQETIASFANEAENGRISELVLFANATLPLLRQRSRTVQNEIHRM